MTLTIRRHFTSELKNSLPTLEKKDHCKKFFEQTKPFIDQKCAEIIQQLLLYFANDEAVLVSKNKSENLTCSVYLKPKEKKVYLISGLDNVRRYRGGNKKGHTIVCIDVHQVVSVVKLTNKLARQSNTSITHTEIVEKELAACNRYSGLPGFVRCLEIYSFKKIVKPNSITFTKHTLLVEQFDGDLSKLKENLSPKSILCIFYRVALALQHMHREGYIHGDIDAKNILYKKEGEEVTQAALWDFGTIRKADAPLPSSEQLISKPWFLHNARDQNYSPESFRFVLEATELTDPLETFRKGNDIYAFGIAMYKVCEGKDPPWIDHDTTELKLDCQNEIATTIEEWEQKACTIREQYYLLVLKMLHPDLKERKKIDQVVAELEELSKKI